MTSRKTNPGLSGERRDPIAGVKSRAPRLVETRCACPVASPRTITRPRTGSKSGGIAFAFSMSKSPCRRSFFRSSAESGLILEDPVDCVIGEAPAQNGWD